MVQMPEVNSQVFYFPQGHAEHACEPVNFSAYSKIPSFIPCRVEDIRYMANHETDEVYAKLRLVPMNINQVSFDNDGVAGINVSETKDKHQSFAKTLTQSDANNGGGFSCPRYCAEMIFPRMDYSGNPPFQGIYPKDVHGEKWHFRHVYRGTPKRHLLTTGWSPFVSDKKLASGDSVVFLRSENGELRVGIWREKRRNNVGVVRVEIWGKVKVLEVIEAVRLGTNMQPFDVVYYPRSGTPEFFVKTSLIGITLQIRWCPGMRFKMPIETEDSSRISWFIGTVASVQAADPSWPDSLWRLLQPSFQQPFNNISTMLMTLTNNSVLQKPNTSENVCSHSISTSTQSLKKPDHAKPHQLVLFGQTIQIDAGNETSEKKMTNHLSDLHLQGLPTRSSDERFEWNPKNQCE
ncbi:auxin response factor 1 [Medicago truncatula]|uniref:Auxin response factor n=2 Tax=Medicago truncatula TaxID=3880 RepID=A0A072U3R9_MEDTR|nr:auxin response factor 1 [Medicago truncatula]